MVSALTRVLGPSYLDVAEEVVQEALLRALQRWPHEGVPAHPEGWLYTVARNLALDRARRTASLATKLDALAMDLPETGPLADPAVDDELAMIFMCCHPALPAEARIALCLKTVGGFSVEEMASLFLVKPATIAQRLVRAKRILRDREIVFELPGEEELPERLETVLQAIYLLFTEGYGAGGGMVVRRDLAEEGLRLVSLLAADPATGRPETHALAALLHLQASRLSARTDADGTILLLGEQDRSRWDRRRMAQGFRHLELASEGSRITTWHLEAAIAAAHAASPDMAATDWWGILDLYDQLLALSPSPVVALNRVVALAEVAGPEDALRALETIETPGLPVWPLRAATRATLLDRLGRRAEARVAWEEVKRSVRTDAEREWIEARHGRP